jgi:hypothetical protein
MDMPFHLKTLPPEALDILRFYAQHNELTAHVEAIVEKTGLSERRFYVALRRLVTKRYLVMDGYQTYRLSESGQEVVQELTEYEANAPAVAQTRRTRIVTRRLVLVTPRVLLSGQPTNIFVGFDEADDDNLIADPVHLLLRLQVINSASDINANKDSSMLLENRSARQVFEISAGAYTKVRLRCFVYQYENEEDVPEFAGGMYVDLNVAPAPASADQSLTAYGVEIQFSIRD